ncbi:ATP synthase F1 subunit delta [Lachnoclostridium sp. An181]|uniref:ATP synthase F1 subunit delta n=1 Tax=Lachnoclostridium sp. An181 TaxID=1965575 RepID=UPI000B366B64|nr:ATP synthase F1 subunit delta [Lachnoclostridium sp. An181]OUP50371.1 ATP synthase F1 subunit delta [Lachnoclostridium sp. An181]
MAKLVSKIYGDALFQTAMEEGRLDEFFAQAKTVKEILGEHGELFKLIDEPKIDREEKQKILETIFGGKIADELTGLFLLLVEKGRFKDTGRVLEYFLLRVKEEKKIGIAKVVSAMELTDGQKTKIEKRLLETTMYVSFEVEYLVNPSLIGGLTIQIGDRIVDGSIRTKLEKLAGVLRNIQVGGEEGKQKRGEMVP